MLPAFAGCLCLSSATHRAPKRDCTSPSHLGSRHTYGCCEFAGHVGPQFQSEWAQDMGVASRRGFHSSVGQSVRLLTSRSGVRASLGAFVACWFVLVVRASLEDFSRHAMLRRPSLLDRQLRYSLAGQDTRPSPERPGFESRWRNRTRV